MPLARENVVPGVQGLILHKQAAHQLVQKVRREGPNLIATS